MRRRSYIHRAVKEISSEGIFEKKKLKEIREDVIGRSGWWSEWLRKEWQQSQRKHAMFGRARMLDPRQLGGWLWGGKQGTNHVIGLSDHRNVDFVLNVAELNTIKKI